MANVEKQDQTQLDINILVAEAQAKNNTIDAQVALDILITMLNNSDGYYVWATLGQNDARTWQCRIPRNDLPDEKWLKEEAAELVHICKPAKFLEAVVAKDKEASSEHCGYVRDDNGKLENVDKMKCARCNRSMPGDLAKAGTMQLKLHKINKVK